MALGDLQNLMAGGASDSPTARPDYGFTFPSWWWEDSPLARGGAPTQAPTQSNAPYWSQVIASTQAQAQAGLSGTNLMKVMRMVAAGATDDQIDKELSIGPATGGGGTTRAPSAMEQTVALLRQQFGPDAVDQYLQQNFLGAMSPAQQAQQNRLLQAQQQSQAMDQAKFAWQQEQARIAQETQRRAEEAERRRLIEEFSSRPRDWATLWSATRGQGIGDYRPAIPSGVALAPWEQKMGLTTGLTEAQGEPNPPWKQFLMSGQPGAMPSEQAFRLPGQGELGPLPSAQYLSSLMPSEVEGLGGMYGRFGLDFGDILAAVKRRLPKASAPVTQYGARRI